MAAAQACREFLSRFTLENLCKPMEILVLEHNMTIGEALHALADSKVLSAPLVVQSGLEGDSTVMSISDSGQAVIGWVDVLDILGSLLAYLEKVGPIPTHMLSLMGLLEKAGPLFCNKMVITVMGGHDKGLVYAAHANASISKAIREVYLQPASQGAGELAAVHRLAIFDAYGNVTNIISQLDILRFVLAHIDEIAGAADARLSELGLLSGRAPLLSVKPSMLTLLAFRAMRDAGVAGAGVLGDLQGELLANLSISDLRLIQHDHLGTLGLPTAEFLAVVHQTSYAGYAAHRRAAAIERPFFQDESSKGMQPVTIHPSGTFRQLLELMCGNRIHRVYVAEQHGALLMPITVLTPTDVLRVVFTDSEQ